MMLPDLSHAQKLVADTNRLFIGAYGFEDRSLGWLDFQEGQGRVLTDAVIFRYKRPKGRNRLVELKKRLANSGATKPSEIEFDLGARFPGSIEEVIESEFDRRVDEFDEVVLDISAMSKFLLLLCLFKLQNYKGTLRVIYSEACDYAPTEAEYADSKSEIGIITKFPSRGVESVIRAKCLSSIRMQGQPVTIVAFASFNEQLVRHILGTITPHRLLFINGHPPRQDYSWREQATQDIHRTIIEEYSSSNQVDQNGMLLRTVSTLDYKETIDCLEDIYRQYGTYERLVCTATGSKMQTLGLFFCKWLHHDIHVEYPTPNSYYVKGMSNGVRQVHEIVFHGFASFLGQIVLNKLQAYESLLA